MCFAIRQTLSETHLQTNSFRRRRNRRRRRGLEQNRVEGWKIAYGRDASEKDPRAKSNRDERAESERCRPHAQE